MIKFTILSLAISCVSFAGGFYINEWQTSKQCLVQNITLDRVLSLADGNHDCIIVNVTRVAGETGD